MTADQKLLWNRIAQFSLDDPDSAFTFSQRLAKENRWSRERAERAIREYKRFMFLGCVAGHPVSPSEDVDQVWHLHLVYTKSYWKDFCGEVLRQPFHHQPTTGGRDESAKFNQWYTNTIESYRKFFAQEPPADIWPARAVHRDLKWVDTERNWVIPKPRIAAYVAAVAGIALIAAAGCAQIGGASVFDYRGPEFLNFFLWFSIFVFAGAAIWREMLIRQSAISVRAPTSERLDPYEIAYLVGRDLLATNSAIISLVEQKHVALGAEGELKLLHPIAETTALHPVERALAEACTPGVPFHMREMRGRARPALRAMHQNLEQRGFILRRHDSARAQVMPLAAALIIPLVGAMKTIVGIARDRPFTYILVATLFSMLVIFFYFARRPFQTAHARRVLKRLRDENAGLQTPALTAATTGATVMPLAFALFGMAALQGTAYARMRKQFEPQTSAGGAGGGCGGASCGGGGGSSCGGGGGGCGGCGGCGGGS